MKVTLYQSDILSKLERVLDYISTQNRLAHTRNPLGFNRLDWSNAADKVDALGVSIASSDYFWEGAPCEGELAELVNATSNRNYPYKPVVKPVVRKRERVIRWLVLEDTPEISSLYPNFDSWQLRVRGSYQNLYVECGSAISKG